MDKRLKELRLAKGMTLKEVATAIGISLQAVSNYEQGIREPSVDIIMKFCKLYDVTSDYLIGLSDY